MPASVKHLKQLIRAGDTSTMLFALWEGDKLYYQVRLVRLDEKNFKATVRYEDGTEIKVKNTSLHIQFNTSELPYQSEDEIVCCICEGADSDAPNELILCDVCQQGYHQDCHQPDPITAKDLECEWTCDTCDYILKQMRPTATNHSTPKINAKKIKVKPPPMRVALKPIRAPKKKPNLPEGATVDTDVQVVEVAKALVETDEFMANLTQKGQDSSQDEKLEKAPENEPIKEKEKTKELEAAPGKEQERKKKKTTKVSKKKIPQPA